MSDIILFWGGESVFSNFHPAVFYDAKGYRFTSSEQYYMFHKAKFHGCWRKAAQIKNIHSPWQIKQIGRTLPKTNEWYTVHAIPTMRNALLAKFSQNPHMMYVLLQTGNATLAESSPYDDFWGIKLHTNDARAKNPNQWKGTNWLGYLLEEVREKINKHNFQF